MARPVIGDFRGVDNNKPRTEAPAKPVEEEKVVDPVEAPVEDEVDPDMLTPAERYRAELKKRNVSLEDAAAIYDAVLSKGYYEEYVRLRGNHRAVFRTRQYDDHLRLQTILEMQKPQLIISQEELITRYNLAASLFEWDGKVLKHDNDTDFENAMRLVKALPAPIFTVLARELSKFDAKVMAVFAEGAEENF